VHPDDRAALIGRLNRSHPARDTDLPAFRVQSAEGDWLWLTGRATHFLDDPDVRALLLHLRPTGRKRDLHRAALARLSRVLSGTYHVPDVVDAVFGEGLASVGAAAGAILLIGADGQHLELIGHAGYTVRADSTWRDIPLTRDTPVSHAVRDQRAIFLSDAELLAQYPAVHQIHAPFKSVAALPLVVGERVIGTILLSFQHDRRFDNDEQEFLLTVADLCAPALDRSRLYHELQQEKDWYLTVTRNASDVVTVIDERGVITYESGSIQRILGYSPAEMLGRNAFELIHPEDHPHTMHALASLAPDGDPVSATYRCLHSGGHWVWLESLALDLRHHPRVQGILVHSRDVTVRVEAQAAREQARQALELSEHNFRRLAENASDLVRQYSACGRVEYCSPSARDLLGYDPEEMLRHDPLCFVHPDDQPGLRAAFDQRFAPGNEPCKFEYRLRRKDGRYLWVESTFRALRDPHSGQISAFIGTTRDIEQRRHAEDLLRTQLDRSRHLLDFTVSMEQHHTAVDLASEALHKGLSLTEYDYGYAFAYDDGAVQVLAEAGSPPAVAPPGGDLNRLPLAAAVRRALQQREAYFLEGDQPVFEPPEFLPRGHWVSLCLLPITRQGKLVSVLVFGTDQVITTCADTRQLLRNVTARLGHALERQHHLEQLNTSREETLRALGLALEYRDYETKGHTDRVVHLTERLGCALGFAGADLAALRWGAFLHDTGKVAIPDAILLKPGKLTPEEWDLIKRHPGIGFEMLHHIPSLPATTLEVVLYHQERWNGSGYPKGLEGTAIPLAARVFAVVDIYDALTSERPYKPAWSHEEAVAQLEKEAGVLLDARVVRTFLHMLSQDAAAHTAEGPVLDACVSLTEHLHD
jgi:PAS domain S-box-containing protein